MERCAGAPSSSNVDDHDPAISMEDVLEEEKRLEEDAKAVLGDSDDNSCTYLMGYVERQALYACATCCPSDKDPAGVCLACSLHCHEGHQLYELYTKRNFRCDCGNSKFSGFECNLCPKKAPSNPDNVYNHNFKGLYCVCCRPYPDPEDQVDDVMIQCVICEDWYHGRHLESHPPDDDSYDEMICHRCMERLPFLQSYTVRSGVTQVIQKESPTESEADPQCDVVSEVKVESSREKVPRVIETRVDNERPESSKTDTGESKPKIDGSELDIGCESVDDLAANGRKEKCLLDDLRRRDSKPIGGATFWNVGWRNKLCTCSKCREMYSCLKVEYLLDNADSMHAYEERGKSRQTAITGYEKGMNALSNMDRTQQIEVLSGYRDMKSELTSYLKRFADNGQVVQEGDIREFFEEMNSRKRQKTGHPAVPQYYCK